MLAVNKQGKGVMWVIGEALGRGDQLPGAGIGAKDGTDLGG